MRIPPPTRQPIADRIRKTTQQGKLTEAWQASQPITAFILAQPDESRQKAFNSKYPAAGIHHHLALFLSTMRN
jgi:hypothetical protein